MSLEHVAYVKTLGQVEVFFTMLISYLWLKQPVKRRDSLGLLLIAIAAIAVMWGITAGYMYSHRAVYCPRWYRLNIHVGNAKPKHLCRLLNKRTRYIEAGR